MPGPNDEKAAGYAQPPKATRFKPGTSGNPRGRPKGTKNLTTDLREELAERIPIREGGKELKVSKQRAFLKSLVAGAVKGDMRAVGAFVSLCARAFGEEREDHSDKQNSAVDDQILESFIAREIERRLKMRSLNSRRKTATSSQENPDE